MFEKLKIYSVHTKSDEAGELVDVKFVREGTNWWAFLFNIFWALVNRCWLLAALCFAIHMVTELLARSGLLGEFSVGAVQLGAFLIVAMLANDELRSSLEKRGYEHKGMATGESKIRAMQRFYDGLHRPAYL